VVPAPFLLGRRRSGGSGASVISRRWRCSWPQTNQPGSLERSFAPLEVALWPPECDVPDLELVQEATFSKVSQPRCAASG
jgi:hypothetical protein